MALSLKQLKNAVRLVTCDHDPICHGFRWHIDDEDALAQLVAWTMQGHYWHAERVLNSLAVGPINGIATVQEQTIRRLTLPPNTKNTPPRWHRDGLVFQHIAWIAAVVHGQERIAASIPHLVPARKGFDALLVPLENAQRARAGIVICEEKATTNPRNQITQEVWPSIESVEAGDRDAELNGELVAILRAYQIQNIEEIVSAAHWLRNKTYRVSITVGPEHDLDGARHALFDGYHEKAPGSIVRRRAETLTLQNLRDWMDGFCQRVVTAVQTG